MGAIVVHDGNFVGVAAPSSQTRDAAIERHSCRMEVRAATLEQRIFDYLRKNTTEGKDPTGDGDRYDVGAVDQAMASADHAAADLHRLVYRARSARTSRCAGQMGWGQLTVWTGTQRPFGVRGQLAEAFHIPEDHVRVLMPDTGSGYGGKHTGETAIEAARLARAAKRPVKVVWTREEEFSWAYFRPAGVDRREQRRAQRRNDYCVGVSQLQLGLRGNSHVLRNPEPTNRISCRQSPLRQGSYRALAATANHFARESHMDEAGAQRSKWIRWNSA